MCSAVINAVFLFWLEVRLVYKLSECTQTTSNVYKQDLLWIDIISASHDKHML